MNEPYGVRLSLALKILDASSASAAIQIVLVLLREGARVELAFLPDVVSEPSSGRPGELEGSLLAAAVIASATADDPTRHYWERWLRARVAWVYRRHGLEGFRYDLQVI